MIRVDATNLKATIGGIEYTWCGGFGAVMQSHERGVKHGDVRMIGNVAFYARRVWGYGWAGWEREVSWCPQHDIDAEWIREFKRVVFAA